MVFRRRGRATSPINSIKHIVDSTGGLTSSTSDNVIAKAVVTLTDPFDPTEVRVGGTINGFFIIVNIIGSTGAPVSGAVDWFIMKSHTGQFSSIPNPGVTGISGLRNQIIHEEKGVPGSGDGTPHVFKGVIVVPKGMRRMREGDEWRIDLKMFGTDTGTFCVKAIYKSYF